MAPPRRVPSAVLTRGRVWARTCVWGWEQVTGRLCPFEYSSDACQAMSHATSSVCVWGSPQWLRRPNADRFGLVRAPTGLPPVSA